MFSRNELKQQRQRASLNKSTFPTSMCCDKTEYTNPRKYCVLQFHCLYGIVIPNTFNYV